LPRLACGGGEGDRQGELQWTAGPARTPCVDPCCERSLIVGMGENPITGELQCCPRSMWMLECPLREPETVHASEHLETRPGRQRRMYLGSRAQARPPNRAESRSPPVAGAPQLLRRSPLRSRRRAVRGEEDLRRLRKARRLRPQSRGGEAGRSPPSRALSCSLACGRNSHRHEG
jgi:hypothetical protein